MKTAIKKMFVGSPDYLEMEGLLDNSKLTCLIMDFPFSCNYNCKKCYRKKNVSMEDLDMDLRKEKIKEAKKLGAKVIYIPGEGEPLMHWEAVMELVEYNFSLDLITTLYTNGSFLTKEIAKFLFDHNVSLIVSCDSLNPEVYEDLTGGGDLRKIKKNFDIVRSIYSKDTTKKKNIVLTMFAMITVVTKQNKNEIAKVKKWCGDDIFFICNYPIKSGNAVKSWGELAGNEIDELAKISNKYTDTGYGGLSAPLANGRCVALYAGITIDTNGNVLVCPASVETKMGSIKNENIELLWKKVKRYVKQAGNSLCIACNVKKSTFKHHDEIVSQHL